MARGYNRPTEVTRLRDDLSLHKAVIRELMAITGSTADTLVEAASRARVAMRTPKPGPVAEDKAG